MDVPIFNIKTHRVVIHDVVTPSYTKIISGAGKPVLVPMYADIRIDMFVSKFPKVYTKFGPGTVSLTHTCWCVFVYMYMCT